VLIGILKYTMPQSILTKRFIFICFISALAYFVFSIYFGNLSLVQNTIFGQFPYSYKLNLLSALLMGAFSAISTLNLVVLAILSLLTGANLALILKRIKLLGASGNLSIIFGGGSILSLAGTGCVSCGLPILGFLGLSASVAHLPMKGVEVSMLAIFLLLLSFFILIKREQQLCKLTK
jgi:hypothetical protein